MGLWPQVFIIRASLNNLILTQQTGCSVCIPLAEILVFVVVGRVSFPLQRSKTHNQLSSQTKRIWGVIKQFCDQIPKKTSKKKTPCGVNGKSQIQGYLLMHLYSLFSKAAAFCPKTPDWTLQISNINPSGWWPIIFHEATYAHNDTRWHSGTNPS